MQSAYGHKECTLFSINTDMALYITLICPSHTFSIKFYTRILKLYQSY